MKCAICNEETIGSDPVKWGPEFAHSTCVIAFKHGQIDGQETEREACAKVCEALELVFECQSAQPGYWPDQIAHKCAIAIRERSNVE